MSTGASCWHWSSRPAACAGRRRTYHRAACWPGATVRACVGAGWTSSSCASTCPATTRGPSTGAPVRVPAKRTCVSTPRSATARPGSSSISASRCSSRAAARWRRWWRPRRRRFGAGARCPAATASAAWCSATTDSMTCHRSAAGARCCTCWTASPPATTRCAPTRWCPPRQRNLTPRWRCWRATHRAARWWRCSPTSTAWATPRANGCCSCRATTTSCCCPCGTTQPRRRPACVWSSTTAISSCPSTRATAAWPSAWPPSPASAWRGCATCAPNSAVQCCRC